MSQNRMPRRIFRPMREESAEGSRKLYNEESHTLFSSSYVIRMTKSRRMR
jgi:hypothetical protein